MGMVVALHVGESQGMKWHMKLLCRILNVKINHAAFAR